MNGRPFLDTNVVLYLCSGDPAKAGRAEALLEAGAVVSVQVLNEFASSALRKFGFTWPEVIETLDTMRLRCSVESLTVETHERGRELAMRYRLPVYDSMIAASALIAGSSILYSEDFQDGMKLENRLTVRNPFK